MKEELYLKLSQGLAHEWILELIYDKDIYDKGVANEGDIYIQEYVDDNIIFAVFDHAKEILISIDEQGCINNYTQEYYTLHSSNLENLYLIIKDIIDAEKIIYI